MDIICRACNATYAIADHKVPRRKAAATCKRCGSRIVIDHRMTGTRHYLFQLAYGEIKKISRGLFRTSLSLARKKGPRRLFTSMKMAFTAEMHAFIAPRLTPADAVPPEKVPAGLATGHA